jgi:NodT family efflux transporter outer membrane factor (OMF) lipoprotein
MLSFRPLLLPSLALLGLGACSTPYARPDVAMPSQFAHADATANAPKVSEKWWESFNDPKLNALVDKVLASNNDLAASAIRVDQAEERAGIASLDQWPSASGSVSGSKTSGSPASYSARATVAYEADLWGRLASASRSAHFEAAASQQDLDAARLSLAGTTCQLYWQIAFLHQQITARQASLDYARRNLEFVRVQHQAGAASGVEEAEAEQTVNAQMSQLSSLQQSLVEQRAALALLMNGQAMAESDEPQALPDTVLPQVDAGLPAELLSRRPDLKASELRLRETLADYDSTRASFYPALNLTIGGGGTSPDLGTVLSHATSNVGASLSLPFLDFPRNHLTIKVARKSYDIAVLNFKQTLLQALSDTDNTLSNRTQLAAQGAALAASLEDAKKAEALYAIRYRAGSVALRVWLDAQDSLRQAQLAYDSNRLDQLVNQSTLYQALGGGY